MSKDKEDQEFVVNKNGTRKENFKQEKNVNKNRNNDEKRERERERES